MTIETIINVVAGTVLVIFGYMLIMDVIIILAPYTSNTDSDGVQFDDEDEESMP